MTIAIACLCGLIAVVCLVQVITGRQLIKRSTNERSASQLRGESAACAVVMIGTALSMMNLIWGQLLAIAGIAWIVLSQKRSAAS
ncbi:hypothetical protein ACF07Y_37075 [Streptomyces sp. NPDC016566]|uniref:hypothetical protein n=1 Tax=Streptomyces sp. NPDC016566 TaxID=3364967 RepID=UPI0036FA2E4E